MTKNTPWDVGCFGQGGGGGDEIVAETPGIISEIIKPISLSYQQENWGSNENTERIFVPYANILTYSFCIYCSSHTYEHTRPLGLLFAHEAFFPFLLLI